MILDRLRRNRADASPGSGDAENGNGAGEPASDRLPTSRYDRMEAKDVNGRLRGHTQVELEAIETHERAHGNRTVILDKLRYLRGSEPLPGYDELGVDEISAALRDGDVETIRAVREYERKFRKRDAVLAQIDAIGRERRATLAANR